MDWLEFGYWGLFGGTFLAATILPFPSEALLIGSYELGYAVVPSLLIATCGNLLGGLTNYYIGYKGSSTQLAEKFKLDQNKLDRWEKHLSKWGILLGFLAWVPFIGDPLVIALGYFKVKFIPLAFVILLGKFLRYAIITMLYTGLF